MTGLKAISRDQARSGRRRAVRGRSVSVKRLSRRDVEIGRALYPETAHWRPRTRGECLEGPRPCPYVSCKHHLYLDVSPRTGAIKLNFPDVEPDELVESCSLDVADQGGATLERIGDLLNVVRERVRQIELRVVENLLQLRECMVLRDFVDERPKHKRRLPVVQP